MIDQILPVVYAGIAGTIGVMAFRAYLGWRKEQLKAATKEKLDISKPEAAIDNLVTFIQHAPAMYEQAKIEMAKIRQANQGKNIDLSAQEQELKLLGYAAKYNRPLMIAAPILGPILKRYVGKVARSL